MGLRVAHVCTMSEIAWRAHLDKYASETDMVLGKLGEKFLLTIGPEKITITPEGCCAGRPHVLPLSMVKEAKMLTSMYSMPSFVIIGEKMVEAPPDEETGEVLLDAEGMPVMVPEHFFHKFFIEGHEASIVEVCNKVDASVRLLQGQVLIAGYIEADVINSVSYFSPADTINLFETESSMITKTVGETKTICLDDNFLHNRVQQGTIIDEPDVVGAASGAEEEEGTSSASCCMTGGACHCIDKQEEFPPSLTHTLCRTIPDHMMKMNAACTVPLVCLGKPHSAVRWPIPSRSLHSVS